MRGVAELLARRRSHPGASRLRAALALDGLGLDRTKSHLERRFMRLARGDGLPAPTVNESMAIPGEEWQCDFVWHRERLIVEVDGWDTHRTRKAFHEDRRRDQLLQAAGWRVLRFTDRDVRSGSGLDRLIVAIAAQQHGVIALLQLLALGLSPRAVRDRIAGGQLHRRVAGTLVHGIPSTVTNLAGADTWSDAAGARAW